jgi:hypothetical protein
MSTAVDNSSSGYLAFLKKYYIGRKALYQIDSYKTPLVGMIRKDLGAGGSTWEQTVGVTNVQGGAATYTNSYANSSAGVDKVFSGNYKKRFADVKIQDFTIKSSRNDDGAVERVLKRKIDSLKDEFMQTINFQLYRDEGGSLCQLGSPTGSLVVFNGALQANNSTLAGVQFIKPQKVINWGPNLDGTNLRGTAGAGLGTTLVATVASRNVFAGTFGIGTVATQGNAINPQPSGSDYIFEDGTAGLALAGLQSWCPLTDTLASTTFKTVDRSIDVTGLGGIRIAGVGESVEETLNDAVAAHRAMGGDPDAVMIHPKRFAQLKKEMSGRLRWVETKGKAMVGGSNAFSYRGLEIDGNGRPVVVYEDSACPTAVTWVIDTNTLCLRSMGQVPFVPDEDGQLLHRIIGTDNWQSELFAYCELVCARPQSLLAICHDSSIA